MKEIAYFGLDLTLRILLPMIMSSIKFTEKRGDGGCSLYEQNIKAEDSRQKGVCDNLMQ